MRRRLFIGAIIVALGGVLLFQLAPELFGAESSADHSARSGSRQGSRGQQSSPFRFFQTAAPTETQREAQEPRSSGEGDEETAADVPGTLSLSGTVTDPEGRPLEGARVQAEAPGNRFRSMRPEVTTDKRGHFRFRSLVPGPYDLSFTRQHFLDQRIRGRVLERDASPLAVVLQPAPTIEGRVVDAAGNPLPGVEPSLSFVSHSTRASSSAADSGAGELDPELPDINSSPHNKNVKTGTDGRFLLDTPVPGLWRLTARLEGYGSVTRELTSPARDVWLVIGKGAGLDVTVVDEQDQPVRGAEVALWKQDTDEPWHAQAFADEAGLARLRGLDPGSYILAAMPRETEGFRIAAQKLEVRGEEVQRIRLRFPPGLNISGVVVDRAGRPVPDVRILAKLSPKCSSVEPGTLVPECLDHVRYERSSDPLTARTGPDGRFFIPHTAPFDYSLKFEKLGYIGVEPDPEEETGERRYRHKRVKAGDHDVRVVLVYRGRVSGRVVRADGEPVRLFELNGEPRESADGTFTEETRGAGEHRIQVLARGVGGTERHYQTREGEDIDLGDLVLGDGRPVRIRVEDASSSRLLPVSWIQLKDTSGKQELNGADLGYDGPLVTGLDGTCLLPDVPRRPLLLTVEHKGYGVLSRTLGPEEEEVRVRLRPLATVQGVVRVHGEPLASGRIAVFSSDGSQEQTMAVKDGRYSAPVSPGPHVFRATCQRCPEPAPVFLPRTVEVPEPLGTLTVDIDDAATGATVEIQGFEQLHGLMLIPGRQPPATSGAQLEALAALSHPRTLLEDQRYRFRDVPAGRYTLLGHYDVDEETTRFLHEELEVPAEGVVRLQLHPR